MATAYETIRVATQRDGAILQITLNQPKANILSMAMMKEISHALDEQQSNKHLKMVLLDAAGGHFSMGASVAEHVKDQAASMLENFHALIRKIALFPVPVVALVQGRCLGGAFEVILACHVVFATETAIFSCPEIKLGVIPPVLAAIGSLRLGGALAERMLITGADIDVGTAQSCGLVSKVFFGENPGDQLLDWFDKNLSGLSAYSIRVATKATRVGSGMVAALGSTLDTMEKLYLEQLIPSFDGNEGITAFIEKRAPKWRDE